MRIFKNKTILITVACLFAINTIANAQKGYINNQGYFAFNSYTDYLKYLDYCKQHDIGEVLFYIQLQFYEKGTKIAIVTTDQVVPEDFHKNHYTDFENEVLQTDVYSMLKFKVVNDTPYNNIQAMPTDSFYQKYISEHGVVLEIKDEVERLAALYRLLKENVVIGVADISGDLVLSTS